MNVDQWYLDRFFLGYMECAFWSSVEDYDAGTSLDENYDLSDIPQPVQDRLKAECKDFIDGNEDDLELYYEHGFGPESAGHDFWLTRNRHGAGFWDRGVGDVGRRLTDASKVYGSVDLYVGDDKRVYASGYER